ncbi:HWE histidine kinase domain-containing protein [Methylocystis sp. B8]|uniref:sensor histidine kinase n=1 Tax=Methylocystis sp. B8 TaxID=544938 RepID=UPI0010FF5FEF|nr:HWE histidine kinase domain-containing protein [Methylocystis sp. B8]TLG79074.1 PAS domain-containing protein [Methylocystis sp. B8]
MAKPGHAHRPAAVSPAATDVLSEHSLTSAIVETIVEPLLVLDGGLRVVAANPAFYRHFKVEPAETLDHMILSLGDGQWNIASLRRLLGEVLKKDSKVTEFRVEHEFQSIGERVMLLNANRMRREGEEDAILLTINDITERERLRFEVEGERDFAEKLIDSIRESILVLGWDLRVHYANQSFYDHFVVSKKETEGVFVWELGNGQWNIAKLRTLLERILPEQNSFDDYEIEHDFEIIGRRTMLLNARRLDHLNLILLAIRDVTEERHNEVRQKALMGELQHRVKNILGKVRSMARQTRKRHRSLDEFMEAFDGRLDALARTQDLLLTAPSGAVQLREIVVSELEAGGAELGLNCAVDGPAVALSPRDAQAMGMTVHELTTNAAKYGALKAVKGRIDISWRLDRTTVGQHLKFGWREHGVKVDDVAPVRGFGAEVIERSLAYMLGGSARLTFAPDGADYRLEFPLPPANTVKHDG